MKREKLARRMPAPRYVPTLMCVYYDENAIAPGSLICSVQFQWPRGVLNEHGAVYFCCVVLILGSERSRYVGSF